MAALGTTMPKVSVVIPNYNHARFLTRRIETVLQQTFQDFEVILLDDCSTDDSRSILSSYAKNPRVKIEFNSVNSGSTFKQWNKGVGLARGEYVWIAESDDYSDTRFLERLVEVLDSEPKAAFAYCRSWRVSDDGLDGFADVYLPDPQRWAEDHCVNGRDECRKYFMSQNIVPNASAVLFRKAIYERVGGADETLSLCGDWKLWAGMALTGRVAYLSEPLNYFRFHDNSVRGKDTRLLVAAEETLHVVQWLQDQVTVTDAMREESCEILSGLWIQPVLNGHVPLERRWAILRSAMAIDPRALRRLVRGGFRALIHPIRGPIRVWLWHPMLNATRPVRHALGLRQQSVRPTLKK